MCIFQEWSGFLERHRRIRGEREGQAREVFPLLSRSKSRAPLVLGGRLLFKEGERDLGRWVAPIPLWPGHESEPEKNLWVS